MSNSGVVRGIERMYSGLARKSMKQQMGKNSNRQRECGAQVASIVKKGCESQIENKGLEVV